MYYVIIHTLKIKSRLPNVLYRGVIGGTKIVSKTDNKHLLVRLSREMDL